MKKTLIQIYEIQKPKEAEALTQAGVDHIGSVLLETDRPQNTVIRKTVEVIRQGGARSIIIPLYKDPARIFAALDYYQPDVVHLCDTLLPYPDHRQTRMVDFDALITLHIDIKDRFPHIDIMRSLSVPRPAHPEAAIIEKNVLEFTQRFAPCTDYFLIDTLLDGETQPVEGFVGITGEVCDWAIARAVVSASPIPVILAGGISPENAFDAVTTLRPAGIDSCTKTNAVDRAGRPVRFKKDMKKVNALIAEVRRADANISGG